MRVCIFVLLLLSIGSCQTIDRSQKAQLTVDQRKYFSSGSKGEGYGSLEVKDSGERKFIGEYEWLSATDKSFTLNILSPFGENILKLEKTKKDKHINLFNRYARNLPLTVGKDGFLVFSNYWVGLRSEEIPSFLQGRIPGKWLENKEIFYRDNKKNKYYFEEDSREIYVDFLSDRICYNIRWNVFWWFRRTGVKICHYKGQEKKSTFLLDDKYELTTKVIE